MRLHCNKPQSQHIIQVKRNNSILYTHTHDSYVRLRGAVLLAQTSKCSVSCSCTLHSNPIHDFYTHTKDAQHSTASNTDIHYEPANKMLSYHREIALQGEL